MTEPDPRTDLAGWLDFSDRQADICREEAKAGETTIYGKVGARLIAQDQADTPDPEPDDGQWIDPTGAGLTEDEARATVKSPSGGGLIGSAHAKIAERLRSALPAPKPPWTSPLPNLPDLTEQDCWYAVKFLDEFPESDCMVAQIGRALKAAGWTPEGEA